jgi:hypothetical protein
MQQMQRLLGALQAEQAALEAQQPADDATQQRLDKVQGGNLVGGLAVVRARAWRPSAVAG